MSAVNAIIKTIFLILPATVLYLAAASAACAADSGTGAAERSTLADRLNRITEREGPGTGRDDGVAKSGGISNVTVQSIIKADETGKKFMLPYYVFYDSANEEIYVIDNGRVTVYGNNFFPVASIGVGRGMSSARGIYVDKQGKLYVPQANSYDKPARLSVYNAAFFPEREIQLDNIPEIERSSPKSLVIGDNGNMYIVIDGNRGLLVLNPQGEFSHWLRPTDLIFDRQAIVDSRESGELEEEAARDGEEAIAEEPDFDVSELLPELVPRRQERVFADDSEPGLGPVQVNDVQRDANGNLYLLSTETSKVYIYTPDEEFLYSFGEKGGSTGKLSRPQQLVVDEKKKAIYIVDYNRHAILIYDLSGRFMHEFGGKGNRPGWFQYPKSIAAGKDGELVVADMYNRRVQVLDIEFEYRFPLFQVPFVYEKNIIYQPQPIQAANDPFYGPGFDAGEQAAIDSAIDDRRIIKSLLDKDDII